MHPWTPFWLSAFLDLPADRFDDGVRFWQGVTGYGLSASRGEAGEFATLVPPDGDDYLRVQRLGSGPGRIHLDLHVPDPRAAADRAVGLGAVEIAAEEVADRGYVVMTSPGGFVFCFVAHPAAVRPAPAVWPGGHHSMVYQVCLDIPSDHWDAESVFWGTLLDGELEVLVRRPEFTWVRPGSRWALDVLLQRLDHKDGSVTAHLDLGTTDRVAEAARHVALGATAEVVEFWTVLRDPTGTTYCVTGRDPATGRLG